MAYRLLVGPKLAPALFADDSTLRPLPSCNKRSAPAESRPIGPKLPYGAGHPLPQLRGTRPPKVSVASRRRELAGPATLLKAHLSAMNLMGTPKPSRRSVEGAAATLASSSLSAWEDASLEPVHVPVTKGPYRKDVLWEWFDQAVRAVIKRPPTPSGDLHVVALGANETSLKLWVQENVIAAAGEAAARAVQAMLVQATRSTFGVMPMLKTPIDFGVEGNIKGTSECLGDFEDLDPGVPQDAGDEADAATGDEGDVQDTRLGDWVADVALNRMQDQSRYSLEKFVRRFDRLVLRRTDDWSDHLHEIFTVFARLCHALDESLPDEGKLEVQKLSFTATASLTEIHGVGGTMQQCFDRQNCRIKEDARIALIPLVRHVVERRLLFLPSLKRSAEALQKVRRSMDNIAKECHETTYLDLKTHLINRFGEGRSTHLVIHGASGAGKTVLVDRLTAAADTPVKSAQNLDEFFSEAFGAELCRNAMEYGRSDVIVTINEVFLGNNSETKSESESERKEAQRRASKLVKFLNAEHLTTHSVPDPSIRVRGKTELFNAVPMKLQVTLILVANENIALHPYLQKAAGNGETPRSFLPSVHVIPAPTHCAMAASGRIQELGQVDRRQQKTMLRAAVQAGRLTRDGANLEWAAVEHRVQATLGAMTTCLPFVTEASDLAAGTMGVVRNVMNDLYDRIELRRREGPELHVWPAQDRSFIHQAFVRHMSNPPPALLDRIARLDVEGWDVAESE